jgi:Domain of unknown function (DUF4232)
VLFAVLGALALSGCSFKGGISAAGTTTPSHGSASTSSAGGAGSGGTTGAAATSGSPGASSAAGGSTNEGPRPDRCHTSELTGRLVAGSPGAGQRYATLTLTDTGGQTCTIDGYGGLGLAAADGSALPTRQNRVASPAPVLVTLHPGQAVSAQLHWGAVTGTGDNAPGACQPTPATLRVIPPDETDALSVPWSLGPVCEQGTIDQTAYRAA